ncbi:MAG: hypothetical protein PHP23_09905 [Desulfobacterales bacterium]|nr:hypothetical protein [Desulfobacterales bacterium]
MPAKLDTVLSPVIGRLTEALQSDIILLCGPIEEPYDQTITDCCRTNRYDKTLLLLGTYGGDPHVAYRMIRRIQQHCTSLSIYVHTVCKSAGTLIALGADEIIMPEDYEIGPIDVQLLKTDEVGERSSGLTITQALATLQSEVYRMFEEYFLGLKFRSGGQITTKSASEIAANIAVGLFSPIYSQIDPMRLGEIDRAVRIATEYGSRIVRANLKDGTLQKLVSGYPDHGFVIDRKEAAELFKNVRPPSESERELADLLQPVVDEAINENRSIAINLSSRYMGTRDPVALENRPIVPNHETAVAAAPENAEPIQSPFSGEDKNPDADANPQDETPDITDFFVTETDEETPLRPVGVFKKD